MQELTITLTGRAPVRVRKADWPIIASAEWHDGQVRAEASRIWRLTVRQHADGRTIVYGVYSTVLRGERDRRGGELLLPGEDIPAAAHRVAEHLGFDPRLAEEVIADLPAEQIA